MVGVIRQAVASALSSCWALLVRSLRPDVPEVAVNPLSEPERALGHFAKFKLASSVTSVSPIDVPEQLRKALDDDRARFASGAMFGSLESVACSGAVHVSHITERGFTNAEHFLAVYAEPAVNVRHALACRAHIASTESPTDKLKHVGHWLDTTHTNRHEMQKLPR